MTYLKGFEHFLFLRVLADAIPKGAAEICRDTERRQQWLRDYPHLLSGAMLLSAFAYAEGILGEGWIEDYGGDFERELNSLRIIRNAITHNDGNIRGNRRSRNRNGEEQFQYVRVFRDQLISNRYQPLAKWDKKKRSTYIELEDSGSSKLGESSYGRIGAVVNSVLMRAGFIKHSEEQQV